MNDSRDPRHQLINMGANGCFGVIGCIAAVVIFPLIGFALVCMGITPILVFILTPLLTVASVWYAFKIGLGKNR